MQATDTLGGPQTRVGIRPIYPSAEARAALMRIYDAKLAHWPVTFEEADVRTRYGRTHVISAGPRDASPLLLVHMAGVASFIWGSIVEPLARRYRIHAVDTIGDVGKSELDDLTRHPKRGRDYSAWLCDVCDALQLDQPGVVAGSMGGWIALNHAAHAPARVRRLALLGPMGLPSWPQTLRVLFRLMSLQLLPSTSKKEKLISWAMGDKPAVRSEAGDWMAAVIDQRCAPRLGSPFPVPASLLESIVAPTLVLLGGNDGPIGPAEHAARRARDHLRSVDVEILPGAGHAMSIEEPQRVSARILRFMED